MVPLLYDCHQGIFIRGTLIFVFDLIANLLQSTLIIYQPIYPDMVSKGKIPIILTRFFCSWLLKYLVLVPKWFLFFLLQPPIVVLEDWTLARMEIISTDSLAVLTTHVY
jgi:hypothetical protein